jgi:tight adherence protein C
MVLAATATFFIAMMSLAAGISYWVWNRGLSASSAVSAGVAAESRDSGPAADLPEWVRLSYAVGQAVAVPGDQYDLRRDLITAGIRDEAAPIIFYGAKAISFALFPLLFVSLIYSVNPDLFIMIPLVAITCVVSYRFPDWYLQRRITKRRKRLNEGLPDMLDLLVISVESGLTLEQALSDTARDLRRAHPDIHDEIAVFQLEIQAGTNRSEALRNLASRTREPEMRKLTSLLIQADRFGTSISKVLRTQARYMRTRRRHRAEELAHKVGVKLIFPIFFLIMPSIFLVTAGPALLSLFKGFNSNTFGQ